jgi:hypothetical protein
VRKNCLREGRDAVMVSLASVTLGGHVHSQGLPKLCAATELQLFQFDIQKLKGGLIKPPNIQPREVVLDGCLLPALPSISPTQLSLGFWVIQEGHVATSLRLASSEAAVGPVQGWCSLVPTQVGIA